MREQLADCDPLLPSGAELRNDLAYRRVQACLAALDLLQHQHGVESLRDGEDGEHAVQPHWRAGVAVPEPGSLLEDDLAANADDRDSAVIELALHVSFDRLV